jgi:subtilase family serine protease
MAAQGQSAFMTSADEAAYDDYDELGTPALSVDNPGDSPYVTTSGGTTLPFSGTSNDNLYFSGTAGTLYNPGAGLGYPDPTQLGKDFAAR